MKTLANLVQREALVLTYNDLLLLIGCLFLVGLALLPLVARPRSFLSR
jgi:DHA2 family multidrug resistance protein